MDDREFEDEEPVELPIEDSIDLHPFQPRDVRDVAFEYLTAARERGFREVRLIHGRGLGVQREIIRKLLSTLDWVESFHDADVTGGGWGATVVVMNAREEHHGDTKKSEGRMRIQK